MNSVKGKLPEEFTPINETVSYSGKYAIAFGQHFRPTLCYDVVAINRVTGECTRRHYNDHKDEALTFWNEFRDKITSKLTESEESDERDKLHIFGPNDRTVN